MSEKVMRGKVAKLSSGKKSIQVTLESAESAWRIGAFIIDLLRKRPKCRFKVELVERR